jgi:sodium/hydrogen exchanger 8
MVLLVGMFFSFLIKVFVHNDDDAAAHQEEAAAGDDNNNYYADQSKFSTTALQFSGEIFFMALLPPILFYSGYELKRELFFRHIKPIVSFAAVGTTVSGVVTGLLLWGIQQAGWMGVVQPSLLEFLTFGALIAATDTVSVLGVLQTKKVDPHLFSLVFGESALNDAVAIVLFRSFSHLVQIGVDDTRTLMGEAALFATEFLLQALGSPAMGIVFTFLAALVFKHLDFTGTPVLELSLYILLMYIPFILAEICHLSGIVTIFFTGMSARRYIEPNVSEETRHNAASIFKLVAFLAETCIFLDLGLSVFGFSGSFHWRFIIFSFVAALVGRAASIYPISFVFNWSLKETVTEPLLPTTSLATAPSVLPNPNDSDRRTTPFDGHVINNMDAVLHNDLKCMAAANSEDDDSQFSSSSSTASSYSSTSNGVAGLRKRRKRRKTPEKRLDKVIPTKFMHVLWFAGLRGAVAYACARDFPDLYGNQDEVVAATMVIVFVTIIIMGGLTEPLLYMLDIRMSVNDKEYMREWRMRRSLKGPFHDFEKMFVYDVVVRGNNNDKDTEGVEMTDNKTTNRQRTSALKTSPGEYQLTDSEGNVRSVETTPTSSTSDAQTNASVDAEKKVPASLDLPPMA